MPSPLRAPDVVVIGHVGRDLALVVERIPDVRGTTPVQLRRELPGGKGYNQGLSLVQLGLRAAVVGAVGDDRAGHWLVESARQDGLDEGAITVRPGTRTSLVVSAVVPGGGWRYFEDLPPVTFTRTSDVETAMALIGSARAVSLQMQEPARVLLAAARAAHDQGRLVVLDGAPDDSIDPDDIYRLASLVRADRTEAELMTGMDIGGTDAAVAAARELRSKGAGMVMIESGREGNAVVWPDGAAVIPLSDQEEVDSTGGGDALVAATIAALLGGRDPLSAACYGTAAAGLVVGHVGGRPSLSPAEVARRASRLVDASMTVAT